MEKHVVLADCASEEIQSLCDVLAYNGHNFHIESYISNWKRTGMLSELKRYTKYFYVGFVHFIKRHEYQVIVGWQQFYVLILCFFCSVFHVKKSNIIVALNFTYKEKQGVFRKPYRLFMRKCTNPKYLDWIHVPSAAYADRFAEDFAFPRERIIVIPFGINDPYQEFSKMETPKGYKKNGYALAIGRSNRDYDFLIQAWKSIPYPLVIISDTYKGTAEAEKITIIRDVAGEESYPWIANCGLMIIPIDDGSICSGDTVLLTAMSVCRKVLITAPSALAQMYVNDGENALLSPKEPVQFRKHVMEVIDSQVHNSLGDRARESFLKNYSRKSMGEKLTVMLNKDI